MQTQQMTHQWKSRMSSTEYYRAWYGKSRYLRNTQVKNISTINNISKWASSQELKQSKKKKNSKEELVASPEHLLVESNAVLTFVSWDPITFPNPPCTPLLQVIKHVTVHEPLLHRQYEKKCTQREQKNADAVCYLASATNFQRLRFLAFTSSAAYPEWSNGDSSHSRDALHPRFFGLDKANVSKCVCEVKWWKQFPWISINAVLTLWGGFCC